MPKASPIRLKLYGQVEDGEIILIGEVRNYDPSDFKSAMVNLLDSALHALNAPSLQETPIVTSHTP